MKIKRKNTIEHTDLIKSFSEKFNIGWNKACDEIGDEDFKGEHDFYFVEEMVEDGYNSRAWLFLKDFMVEKNLKSITVN